jgi:BirA family transcriptional regulator, biotin operon repressor / biotin---[acetyl-CoA-carboxylase] ligase
MATRFDVDQCKNRLRTTWLGSEFIYIKEVDSTNTWLKRIPSGELIHGTVAITDHQTKGRGQYERSWEAAPFQNLTFTIAFRPPKGERLSLLTLACASAIAQVLERYTNEKVLVKWPNDILVRNKKIGGLLTECIFNGPKPDRVLIGIGLNIFQKQFGKEIHNSAVSLSSISSQSVTREQLLGEILSQIELIYHRWHRFDEDLQREINHRLIGYGEWVQISVYDKLTDEKFKFIGVNEKGELLMLNEQLDVNKFSYEQIRIIAGNESIPKAEKGLSA